MRTHYFIILYLAILFSCAEDIDSPTQVTQKYWGAIQNSDTELAQQLVAKNNVKTPDDHIKKLTEQQTDKITIGEESTTVSTTLIPKDPQQNTNTTFQTSLVFEDNQWKIDLDNTHIPDTETNDKKLKKMTDKLSKSMENSAASIESLLKEGTELLNEALRDGSKEMNKTMLDAMNKLNEQIQNSIENIKKRREEQKPSKTKPDSGEGLI